MQVRGHTSLVAQLLSMYGLTTIMITVIGISVLNATGASLPPSKSTTLPSSGSSRQAMSRDETSDEKTTGPSGVSTESEARIHLPQVHRLPELEEAEDSHATTLTQSSGVIIRHTTPIERLGSAQNAQPQGPYHPVRPATVVVTPNQPTKLVRVVPGRRPLDASSPHQSTSTTISISAAAAQEANRDESDEITGPSSVSTEMGEPQSKRVCTDNLSQAHRLPELKEGGESRPTTSTQREGVIMRHTAPIERLGSHVHGSSHTVGPEVAQVRPTALRLTSSALRQGVIITQNTAPVQRQGSHAHESSHIMGPGVAQARPIGVVRTPNRPTKFVPAILRRTRHSDVPPPTVVMPTIRVRPPSRPVQHSPGLYPFWKFVIDRIRAGARYVRWVDAAQMIFTVDDQDAFAAAWRPFSPAYHDRPSMPFSVVAGILASLRTRGRLVFTPGYLQYRFADTDEIRDYLASTGTPL